MVTSPGSIFQLKFLAMPAFGANACGSSPAVNQADVFASLFRLPLDFLNERGESKVVDFATPYALHTLETEILEKAPVKLADKVECEFPVVVSAAVADLPLNPRQPFSATLAVGATFARFGMLATGSRNVVARLAIELGTIIFFTVTARQHIFQSEIEPCGFTCLWLGVIGVAVDEDGNIEIVQSVTLDGDTPNVAVNRSAGVESIPLPIQAYFGNFFVNGFNANLRTVKRHGFVFFARLETCRSFRKFVKEPRVSKLNSYQRIEQTPRVRNPPVFVPIPFLKLCQVLRKAGVTRSLVSLALAIYSVMSTRQCDKMVVDIANDMQIILQMLSARMALKFEFEGFHLFFWFSTYSFSTLRVTPPVDATNFNVSTGLATDWLKRQTLIAKSVRCTL